MNRFKSFREAKWRKQVIGDDETMNTTKDETANETTPMLNKRLRTLRKDPGNVDVDNGLFNETYSRKIARFLSQYSLYNPGKDAQPIEVRRVTGTNDEEGHDRPKKVIEPPSLVKAWDYFEYQCLPRRFAYIEERGDGRKYVLASRGEEEPTKLYPVYDTPIGDMADFGIGIGMYFQSLRFFGIVCFMAGCLSIPMMYYYASDMYSSGRDDSGGFTSGFISSTSGVCTNQKFKPCPSCPKRSDSNFIEGRMFSEDGMTFILTNHCELNAVFGYCATAALFFVLGAVYYFVYMQRKYRIELDVSEQTSTDYSIRIMNPPTSESSKDPETWKKFFEDKFENVQVTVCTVAINNEKLVKALLNRFILRTNLIDNLPIDIEYDESDLDAMAEHTIPLKPVTRLQYAIYFIFFFCLFFFVFGLAHTRSAIYAAFGIMVLNRWTAKKMTGYQIVEKMRALEIEIQQISSETNDLNVTDVFVTFETEQMQRVVLENMFLPKFRKNDIPDELRFEGVILEVDEPDEPSSIRWEDLDVPFWTHQKRKAISFALSFALTITGGFIIAFAKTHSAVYSTILIVLLNALSPRIVYLLTERESHDTQTSFATSAYLKITLIRWVYTVLVNFLITPFTDILSPGKLIEQIRLLYTAEVLQKPILQLFDIGGNIKRHFFGPRAKDQRNMNLIFMAKPYFIGEKYTEVTKLLFFTFFYAVIFPIGFFYAALIFLVYYWVDKFCILRQWRQGPKINAQISLYSTYYLWFSVLLYGIAASYTVAEFPFDNACLTNITMPEEYVGQTIVIHEGELNANFTISAHDEVYEVCDQNILRSTGFASFPPIPEHLSDTTSWMSIPQLHISKGLGSALTAICVLIFSSIFIRLYIKFVKPLFDDKWTPDGKASDVRFSDVPEIYGYVPSAVMGRIQYPVLLCDVTDINHELISWTCNYDHYSVIYDVPDVYRKRSFSSVKSWKTDSNDLRPPSAKFETIKSKNHTLRRIIGYYSGLRKD